jgi:hypothetical protein
MFQDRWTDCEGFHRRDFLKIGTAGLIGLSLPQLLRLQALGDTGDKSPARTAKAKSVILVWLAGGPATIDMWDIKTEAPAEIKGEFKPIDTAAAGVQISEHLPKTAKVMDKATVIRSLHHTIAAHGPGTVYMTTGNKPTPALQFPSLGSLASKLLETPPGVPPYVTFSQLRNGVAGLGGYLGTAYNPFEVEGSPDKGQLRVRGVSLPASFSLNELEDRNQLLERFDSSFKALDKSSDIAAGLDKFHQQALDILRSDRTKKAFDLTKENQATRDRYGKDAFGQGALAARRLVEAGVRFVTIGTGGWDTHGNNFKTLKDRNLPQLDTVLSALITDLAEKGMLDSTIVYCAGEFGRTPKINKNTGRDHWARSMATLVAGGGFKQGYGHGTTDVNGMAPATDPVTPDDMAATIFSLLGIDPHKEIMTTTGRPITIFREGKVQAKLLA